MSPFARLGLPADADERAIKRAYAQQLRHARPEDDPEAFQQLHAAYQAALDWCRRRAAADAPAAAQTTAPARADTTVDAEPISVPVPADTPDVQSTDRVSAAQPSPATFSIEAFCAEAIAIAARGDAIALESWLGHHPALWSLQIKAQTGRLLVQRLYRQAPPMPAPCLATVLRFFDLDHALAGHDPLALQLLQRRMQLAWEFQADHRGELAARLNMSDRPARRKLDRALRQLARPFQWPQALLSGIDASKPRRIADIVTRLAGNAPDALPAAIQRDQLRFWLAAADRTKASRPRLQLGAARCVASLLAALLLGLLCGLVFSVYPDSFSWGPVIFLLGGAALGSTLWALLMAWLPLENWHSRREELPARWPWLCLALVPALCAAGLLLTLSEWPMASLLLILPAMLLALRRYGRRQGGGKGFAVVRRFIWIIAVLLSQAVHALKDTEFVTDAVALFPAVVAGIALIIWSTDLWKNRRRLRVMNGRHLIKRQAI